MKGKVAQFAQQVPPLEGRVSFAKEMASIMAEIDYTADSSKFQERAAVIGENAREQMIRFGEKPEDVFTHAFQNLSSHGELEGQSQTLRSTVEALADAPSPSALRAASQAIDASLVKVEGQNGHVEASRARLSSASDPKKRIDLTA
jgi:hypothetical protein